MARITDRFVKTRGQRSTVNVVSTRTSEWNFTVTFQRSDGAHKRLVLDWKEAASLVERIRSSEPFIDRDVQENHLITRKRRVVARLNTDLPLAINIAKDLVRRRRVAFYVRPRRGKERKITLDDIESP